MKKLFSILPMGLLAVFMLLPAATTAQNKTKRLDAQAAARTQRKAAPGVLTLNSNTTMYGVFQTSDMTFLGKTKLSRSPLAFTQILTTLVEPSIGNINCAACVDGTIYTLYSNPISYEYTHTYELRKFDANTGEQTDNMTSVSPIYVSEAQTTDPLTGRSWGRFAGNLAGDRWEIAWVDYRTMERHAVGQARRSYICMGMTTAQELYAVGKDGWLYRISTEDGSDTPIGELGISNYIDESGQLYHMNGAINPEDNRFYMTFADNDLNCSLLSIDLQTGKATRVAVFSEPTLALVTFFPENNAANGTPAEPTDVSTHFDSQTLAGNVTFTLPTLTYDGKALEGTLTYEVRADGHQVATGSGAPGETITTSNFSFQTQGMHGVEIIAANSTGAGAHAFHSFYVGVDTPAAPTDIQTQLNGTSGQLTLTWQAPAGMNEGYVGDMTYSVVRYPDNETVATGLTTRSFTDQLSRERDVEGFTYGISATNSMYTGAEGLSGKVVFGAPLDVPYKATFTPNDMRLYTLIDVTGDGKSFGYQYSSAAKIYMLSQTHTPATANAGEMDDWFITPQIKLVAGRTYRFSIPQYLHPAMSLTVAYGTEPTAQGLTNVIVSKELDAQTDWDELTQEFTVPTTGNYHIALHAVNQERCSRGIYVRDHFSVEAVTGENVPQAPTQFSATGGANGAKTVHLTFTAPTKTVNGDDISGTLTMNVRYRNRIVVSRENVTPGQTVEADYANEFFADGYIDLSVTAANAEGDGAAATTQVYVGVDVPVLSGTVTVTDNVEAQVISWQPVATRGANGFYVNPDDVEYIIYDVSYDGDDDEYVFYEEIARVKGVTSYRYEDLTNQGDQHETFKGVRAVNKRGQSELVRSGSFIKGAPYSLPFYETLEGGYTNGKLWWTEEQNTTSSPIISDESYDVNSGSFSWTAGANRESVSINTGKISLRNATNQPVVSYAYYGEVGDQTTITVYAVTPDGVSHQVGDRISLASTKGDDEWRTASADLSAYQNEECIIVKFLLSAGRRNENLKIDAISIYNILQYNLAVDLSAPTVLKAGTEGKVNITVRNTGSNTISNYTVKLSVNDQNVLTRTITEPLASQQQNVIETIYKPSPNTEEGTAYLLAEVETAIDLDEDDNWMEAETEIREATAAQPIDVKLENAALTWNTPGETTENVVEQFDDFTSYANPITATDYYGWLNEWFVYDGDGEESGNFMANYPGRQFFAPQAWLVWDTATPSDEAPAPIIGSKYLVSLSPSMNTADDWLVSPLLSGQAQTVTFRLHALGDATNDSSTGAIEVLYTTADLDEANLSSFINSFQSVTRANAAFSWQRVEALLPAGAKHFAVRNVSTTGMGVAVALVSFEEGRPAPTSFNIYGDGQLLANVSASSSLTYVTSGQSYRTYGVSAVYANGEESKTVSVSDPTGIRLATTTAAASHNSALYNLQGQRLSSTGAKGIYVQDGRKKLVK